MSIPKLRVLVCDDHRIVAEALCNLLERAGLFATAVDRGSDAIHQLARQRFDCVLLDLLLPDMHGLYLIPRIHAAAPETRVIVLTMYENRHMANACLGEGAHAYLPKRSTGDELLVAIDATMAGRLYISPLLPTYSEPVPLEDRRMVYGQLTPRQREIVQLVGGGMRQAEIARLLGLSKCTITYHHAHIMRALGVATVAEFTRVALLLADCTPCPPTPVPESPSQHVGRLDWRQRQGSAPPLPAHRPGSWSPR